MKRLFISAVLATIAVTATLATVARASTMEEEVRAVFDKYISTQNAHDLKGMRNLLSDSPDMLWISRGKPIWGRDAALKTLEDRYKGTWKIDVDKKELRVIAVSRRVAQVYAPTLLSTGEPGTEPSRNRLYINLVMVKKPEGWQIVSILPILVTPQ